MAPRACRQSLTGRSAFPWTLAFLAQALSVTEEQRRRLSFRDVTKIVGRLPKDAKEYHRARRLILKQGDCKVAEDELAHVLPLCLYLES
jgi:hypothetical protein